MVYIGAFEVAYEIACIGREGLNVTALSLGIYRIKSQGGLAAAAEPGDYGKRISRNGHINILQIVDACPGDSQYTGAIVPDSVRSFDLGGCLRLFRNFAFGFFACLGHCCLSQRWLYTFTWDVERRSDDAFGTLTV